MNNMKFSEMIVDAFTNENDAHSITVNSNGGWYTSSHVVEYAVQSFCTVSKEYYNHIISFSNIGNSYSNLKMSEMDKRWFNNSNPFKSLYHRTTIPISSGNTYYSR